MSQLSGTERLRAELDHSPGANSTDAQERPQPTLHSLSQFILAMAGPSFTCPGETHPISYSVHLARLASGYANCRNCSQNLTSTQLRSPVAAGPEISDLPVCDVAPGGSRRPAPKNIGFPGTTTQSVGRSLVTANGIRGIYLNELDRIRAADWGAAFASVLWERQPRIGRSTPGAARSLDQQQSDSDQSSPITDASSPIPSLAVPSPARRGPTVVIGFDERPSSPDMIVGVALGLRRMGCQVIDLGQTTRPCFHFAVHHLEAAGGIFVTGDGCDPAWTGFHFAGRGALPWLQPGLLHDLESRAKTKGVRPTRTAGAQRPFHASIPYQTGLWKLFHALRPLQVVCGTATRQLPRVLDSLFARLPCRLTHEILPVRRRNLGDPNDVDVRRVASAVVSGQQHLGLIVDDDGERCAFVTDRGQLVSVGELARLLVSFELHEHRAARILIDEALFPEIAEWLTSIGQACQIEQVPAAKRQWSVVSGQWSGQVCPIEQASAEQLPTTLMEANAHLGIGADHRVWFGGTYPACNAIMTLARVLQALSLSDAPMSELLHRAE